MVAPALRRGEVIRIRDERWTVSRHVFHVGASVVDVRGCDRSNRGLRARFLLPFDAFERLPLASTTRVVTAGRWRHLARAVLARAVPSYDALRTVASADIDILPFQLEPALAVVRGLAGRLLIADDVGLGKTVQAGLIVSEVLERDPDAHLLVVTPAALRQQWVQELESRFRLAPAVIDSASLARPGTSVTAGANPWAAHPLIVTSVDYLKRPEVLRSLEALVWDVVIVDEAHGVAGRSDRNAAILALGERARALVLLTATPHSGNEETFERLCGIGNADRQFPLLVFRRTRQDAGLASARRTTWLRVAPTAAELEMHRALIAYARLVWRQHAKTSAAARLAMLVLTRRGCSSAASLARSVERRLSLLADCSCEQVQLALPLDIAVDDDNEPGAELGAPGLVDRDDERQRLETILTLAQRARGGESKLGAVRRLLRRTREPAIVFTEYRDTLVPLAAELARFNIAQLHGGLGAAERNEVLRQFESEGASVLLATDAASEGLNLHHRCRLVVNLEVPWTPVRLEQRVGRVDRIGQRLRVHQVHLVAAGTNEDSIIAPLVRRRTERVRQALGAMRPALSSVEGPPAMQQHEVANRVFGGDPVSGDHESASAALPEGVVVADLRESAAIEAERASAARALAAGGADAELPTRLFAAAVHRRGSRAYWAFRLELCDADEELVWETILGVSCQTNHPEFTRAEHLRRHVDSSRDALTTAVRRHQHLLLARIVATLQSSLVVPVAREQAILAAIERRHARLGAAVVQAGLFDRRLERETAAQRMLLQESLGRCSDRLARLIRRQQLIARPAEPMFAVIAR